MKKAISLACLALLGFAAMGMQAQDDVGQNAAKAAQAQPEPQGASQ